VGPVLLEKFGGMPDELKAKAGFTDAAANVESAEQQGYQAAFGIALQGLFTLETVISWQCFVHWAGAAAGIQGAMTLMTTTNSLYSAALTLERQQAVSLAHMEPPSPVLLLQTAGGEPTWLGASAALRLWLVESSSGVLFALPFVTQIVGVLVGRFTRRSNHAHTGEGASSLFMQRLHYYHAQTTLLSCTDYIIIMPRLHYYHAQTTLLSCSGYTIIMLRPHYLYISS
jgi:hypothetical protein